MHIERYKKGKIVIKVKKAIIEKTRGGGNMRRLNISKLRAEKQFVTISSQEALEDVTPINWSKEVLEGKKKVEVTSTKN